jgi:uncharacterized DUF497 family protein
MRYDWNPAKAAANLAKHGVAFETVVGFEWDVALIGADLGQDEVRLVAIGYIGLRVHTLVFTPERRCVWVISLRKASKKEIARYAEA